MCRDAVPDAFGPEHRLERRTHGAYMRLTAAMALVHNTFVTLNGTTEPAQPQSPQLQLQLRSRAPRAVDAIQGLRVEPRTLLQRLSAAGIVQINGIDHIQDVQHQTVNAQGSAPRRSQALRGGHPLLAPLRLLLEHHDATASLRANVQNIIDAVSPLSDSGTGSIQVIEDGQSNEEDTATGSGFGNASDDAGEGDWDE